MEAVSGIGLHGSVLEATSPFGLESVELFVKLFPMLCSHRDVLLKYKLALKDIR